MKGQLPLCPCCGADDVNLLGRLPNSEWFAGRHLSHPLSGGCLYRCSGCRLKFRYPIETADTYDALYDNAETGTWPTVVSRTDWELILAQIKRLVPNGGNILDFGCYTGGLLSQLDRRYKRFGVEVNRDAARIAERDGGARVWPTIHEIPLEQRFDVIVMSDVVEHVPNPVALFEALSTRMANGGVILVTTGDADAPLWNLFGANWWYCFYPEHIAFISLVWARKTLCTQGWSILRHLRFRHGRLGTFRRLANFALACVYGMAPRTYFRAMTGLKAYTGRASVTSVPGNGVSADHLLLVLCREQCP